MATQLAVDNQLIEALVSYLPPAVTRAINADPYAPIQPREERFAAAVLLADVSGFTALTEKLAARGPTGAEELTLLLNRYFSRMIGVLEDESGEVVQFSGDALIAVFRAGEPGSLGESAGPADQLRAGVRRAWQAAVRMQHSMADLATLETSVGSVGMEMKIGIGAGEVLGFSVGGVLNRWQYIIAGDPLAQVAEAEHRAQRGEIVLSPQAQAWFADQPVAPRRIAPLHWAAANQDTIAALRTHIPGAITYRLLAGQADWLAELRRMTIVFLGIGGLQYGGPSTLEQIQATMVALQQTVYRYEGSINKLLVDDKGAISVVLFGAPPMSHIDDPLRGVRCALELQEQAAQLGLRLTIGVTTGQVCAGPVGSPSRREYTVIGDAVNLAARLMQLAEGGIFCDHATFHATQADLHWCELAPQTVKGKAAAVRIYQPLGRHVPHGREAQLRDLDRAVLVGRAAELARIERLLDESAAGELRVLFLEGEPGMGKSRLVAELSHRLRARGLVDLLGSGQAIGQQIAYRAWQDVFGGYFGLDPLTNPAERGELVQRRLDEIAPQLIERAPLLNDLLGLGLPETSLTEHLDPKLRQDSLLALLIDLLGLWAAERPLVLVLEDAQWLDALSWQLALQVARSLAKLPILLMLALRPPEQLAPEHPYWLLRGLAGCEHMPIAPLSPAETVALAAAHLGAHGLPPELAQLIEQRAAGNPFVAEELAFGMRDSGLVEVVEGRCVVRAERHELHLPDTVQGLVLSRIDRLPVRQQLTLKVAAVIGRIFGFSTLRDIYPSGVAEADLRTHIESLAESDIVLPMETPNLLRSHAFKQMITQEVTYRTLLLSQRRDLHERAARWYELLTAEQADLYPLLVYHWHEAQNREKELQYAVLAAKKLAAEYANQAALIYIDRALELAADAALEYDLLWLRVELSERIGDTGARRAGLQRLDRLITWQRDGKRKAQLANAWAALHRDTSDYPAAIDAIQRAITTAHQSHDQASEARSLTIWGQVAEFQGAFREARDRFERALALYREIDYRRGEANNLSHLGNVHSYLGNELAAREYYLQALGIRQQIGDQAGQAISLNNLSLASLALGDADAARSYQQQALAIARRIGDRAGEALSLGAIGQDYLAQGNYSAAKEYLEQTLQIYQTLGERRREANCLNVLGQVWRDVGEYAGAQRCFERALAIQLEIGDHSQAAYSAGNLAYVLAHSGGPDAPAYFEQAIDLARDTGNREAEAAAHSYRGGFHELRGDWAAADDDHRAALAIWDELDIAPAAIEDRAGLGRAALAQGQLDEAREHATACMAHLSEHGVEGMEFPLAVYLGCHEIVRAAGESTAADELRAAARALLQARAAAITDPAMRESLLMHFQLPKS